MVKASVALWEIGNGYKRYGVLHMWYIERELYIRLKPLYNFFFNYLFSKRSGEV